MELKGWLFGLLITEVLAIVAWSALRRERLIELPFLCAGVYLGWMLPQLIGLMKTPFLPEGGLEKTLLMAMLCLAGVCAGWAANRRPAQLFDWRFDESRLLAGAAVLSLVGAFFHLEVRRLAPEVNAVVGDQWTGIITIYAFFASILSFGFAIALMLWLRRPRLASLLIVLFGLAVYLHRILILGRRAAMVELGLMVLLALWFNRRWLPPRTLVLVLVGVGALVINGIGEYRNTMLGQDRATWSGAGAEDVLQIGFVENLSDIAEGEHGIHELQNVVFELEAIERLQRFDYGVSHWNALVQWYVPGQWVGYEFKEELKADFGEPAFELFGYVKHTGTTDTGLTDAFQSFWFLGALKFLIIGFVFSRWYRAACEGHFVAMVVTVLIMTPALHTITHNTHRFVVIFINLAVFLLPVLLWARVRQATRQERHFGCRRSVTLLTAPHSMPRQPVSAVQRPR